MKPIVTPALTGMAVTFSANSPGREAGGLAGRPIMKYAIAILILASAAIAADCNAPVADRGIEVKLPGPPFKIAVSKDGCQVFASLAARDSQSGIAVLERADGQLRLIRTIALAPPPTGIALAGDRLLATTNDGSVFLDVERMRSGGDPKLGIAASAAGAGAVYVAVTKDERLAFVSNERNQTLTVIDLAKGNDARAVVGTIPVGIASVGLAFSPDGKYLYTTSQTAIPEWGWPEECDPENPRATSRKHAGGAVVVVDVSKAGSDPAHSVVGKIPAGCNPVRVAVSADGARVYVTARKSDAVLVFDAPKLIADPEHAEIARIGVGTAPVPITVLDGEHRVIAGNSNRFGTAGSGAQSLSVIDTASLRVIGQIAAGEFPRDLVVSPDGKTLFVANFGSETLQAMNTAALPLARK